MVPSPTATRLSTARPPNTFPRRPQRDGALARACADAVMLATPGAEEPDPTGDRAENAQTRFSRQPPGETLRRRGYPRLIDADNGNKRHKEEFDPAPECHKLRDSDHESEHSAH